MNPISIFIPESQSSFKLDSSEEDRPISAPSNSSSQTRKENIFHFSLSCNIVVSLSGFFFLLSLSPSLRLHHFPSYLLQLIVSVEKTRSCSFLKIGTAEKN